MLLLNYILELVNQRDEDGQTIYEKFVETFGGIFTSVENKVWMENWVPLHANIEVMKSHWSNIKNKVEAFKRECGRDEEAKLEAEQHE